MIINGFEIPDIAICHQCGQPMKLYDLSAKAKKLGFTVPPHTYVIKCCGYELTIDDEKEDRKVEDALLAYYEGRVFLD